MGDLNTTRKTAAPSIGAFRVTMCKVCHLGVFSTQKRRWSNQLLGISHNECLDQLEAAVAR